MAFLPHLDPSWSSLRFAISTELRIGEITCCVKCYGLQVSACCSGGLSEAWLRLVWNNGRTGAFCLEVHPSWAAVAVRRFRDMIDSGYFINMRFYNKDKTHHAVTYFGLAADGAHSRRYENSPLKDESPSAELQTNERGLVAFCYDDEPGDGSSWQRFHSTGTFCSSFCIRSAQNARQAILRCADVTSKKTHAN